MGFVTIPDWETALETRTDWSGSEDVLSLPPEGLQANFSLSLSSQHMSGKPFGGLEYELVHVRYFVGLSQTGHARLFIFGNDPGYRPWNPKCRFDEFYPQGDGLRGRRFGTFALAATFLKLLERNLLTGDFLLSYPAQTSTSALHRIDTFGLLKDGEPLAATVNEFLEKAALFTHTFGYTLRE